MKTAILILALAAFSGCAAYDGASASDADLSANRANPTSSDFLYEHDPASAREAYRQTGDNAGVAITSLMLLPYSDAATRLITDHLGGRDALDAQGDVIWGDQGLAYFISRGVAWDDSPSTAGVKTLLVDRLPWSRRQLDTVDGFVSGLSRPAGLLTDAAVALADELGGISASISAALDTNEFSSFFVPGQVFHDDSLDVTLGKPEFAGLQAVIEGSRAVIYFVAAYDHAWTLERAFGESVWEDVAANPDDPDYIDGAAVVDYQVAHLNESLGRAVKSAAHLESAQESAAAALTAVASMFRFGAEQTTASALDWRRADDMVAEQLAQFFDALADATTSQTELPFMAPSTTADLSLVFDGRTLSAEQNLLMVDRYADEFGTYEEVILDEGALTAWTDGVFSPDIEGSELTIEQSSSDLVETITNDLFTSFEASTSAF